MVEEDVLDYDGERFEIAVSDQVEWFKDNVLMKIRCTSDQAPQRRLIIRFTEDDQPLDKKVYRLNEAREIISGHLWMSAASRDRKEAQIFNRSFRRG